MFLKINFKWALDDDKGSLNVKKGGEIANKHAQFNIKYWSIYLFNINTLKTK